MIRAIAGNMLLIGLSDANVKMMTRGKPISFDLSETPFPPGLELKKIVIFWGATEQDMKKDLAPYIDAETRIHGEEH